MSHRIQKPWLAMLVLLLTAPVLHAQIKLDQSIPETQKAVIGINVNVQSLYQNKLWSGFLEMVTEQAEDMPFKMTDLTKISALISAPKGVDPESLEKVDAYVYVGFKNAAAGKAFKQMMMDTGGEMVDLGGKSFIDPDESMFPPGYFVDAQDSYFVVATQAYITSKTNQFATKGLVDTYGQMAKSPIRIAIDLDGARDVLDQVSAMANASATLMTKPYISLIDEVSSLELSSDLEQGTLLKLGLHGHDDAEGGKIKLKLDALLGLAKQFAQMAPQDSPEAEMLAQLDKLEAVQNGKSVTVLLPKPAGFEDQMLTMMEEARKAARGAALVTTDMNNLREVLIAAHNYHDTHRAFPFKKHAENEDAGSGLSWVVMLLPYMEQGALYDKFKLDESFDSEANAPLGKIKIRTLELNTGGTISFVRPATVPARFADIKDGSSNTVAVVQDRSPSTDPWSKPKSIKAADVLAQFKALKDGEVMLFGMYDGSVRRVTNQYQESDIVGMLEPDDGKFPMDFDEFRGPPRNSGIDGPGKGSAKSDDPFGAPSKSDSKKSDDPFGAPSKSDSKKSDDPFGAPSKSDDKKSDDPFGAPSKKESNKSDDPFGM